MSSLKRFGMVSGTFTLVLALAVIALLLVPSRSAPAAVVVYSGDVDCNGSVDAVDALKILRHVAGLTVNLEPGCPPIGGGPTPTPSGATFGDGTWIVGQDITSGIWRNDDSSQTCYWERLRGFGGTLDDIIANELSTAIQTVEIKANDAGFKASRCGLWSQNLVPPSSGPTQPFGPGVWLVGSEIAPGIWRNSDSSANCYWERRSGLSGEFQDIIANEYSASIQTVTIQAGDVAFQSERCGTWTRLGG